jgi:hypothetical protein
MRGIKRKLKCPICHKSRMAANNDGGAMKRCRGCYDAAQRKHPRLSESGKCAHCGQIFRRADRSRQYYCSLECARHYRSALPELVKECPTCGDVFVTRNPRKVFCCQTHSAYVNSRNLEHLLNDAASIGILRSIYSAGKRIDASKWLVCLINKKTRGESYDEKQMRDLLEIVCG